MATWTREVYGRVSLSPVVECCVFASDEGEDGRGLAVSRVSALEWRNSLLTLCRNREFRGLLRGLKHQLRTGYAARAAKFMASESPDLIHVHNDPEAVLPIRKWNPEAKIILHMNNDHLIEGHVFHDGIAAKAVAAADWIACCSSYIMQGAMEKLPGLPPEKCFVIHNGADLPPEPPVLSGAGFKSVDGPVLLYIGRIVEQKGLHLLIEAMAAIRSQFPNVRLKVVGGVRFGSHEVDPYLASLQDKAESLADAVEFLGPVPHGEVAAHLAAADVFVCPSIWNEPLGMVNLEAMGAGVPVVAFSRGGIPEALSDAGVLVEELSAGALAAAICCLLGDDERRRELAARGRERVVRQFSWDVIARQWEQRLRQMTK